MTAASSSPPSPQQPPHVQRMHQILLWPLRLMPVGDEPGAPRRPWELLRAAPGGLWREVVDEYTGGS